MLLAAEPGRLPVLILPGVTPSRLVVLPGGAMSGSGKAYGKPFVGDGALG